MTRRFALSQLDWKKYPVRVCKTLHYCELCCKDITAGNSYYDGGYSRRVHVTCVAKSEERALSNGGE